MKCGPRAEVRCNESKYLTLLASSSTRDTGYKTRSFIPSSLQTHPLSPSSTTFIVMAPKPAKRDYAAEFEVAATSYTHFYETLIPIYHDVVIVGTGVSAIAMAIQLKRGLGVSDVLLIDKEGGIGGTWYSNSCEHFSTPSKGEANS